MNRNQADFGSSIVHMGSGMGEDDGGDGGSSAPSADIDQTHRDTVANPPAQQGAQDSMCSKGMCDGMAAATQAAVSALGPRSQSVPPAQMQALASDKTPAGQAAYQAALQQNAAAAAQNSQRQAIISQFVKDAVGQNVSAAQMKLGDAALAQYAALKQKYGPAVADMTLNQLVAQYPQDAQQVVASLAQVFPALKGKSFDQIWAMIPSVMKDMPLGDIENAIPNSSWGKTGVIPGVSNTTLAEGAGGLLLLGVVAYFAFRKKKGGSNASGS